VKNLEKLSEVQNSLPTISEWPEITELPSFIPKAPVMTVEMAKEMLPSPIREWVMDFSRRAQVPIESAAVCALGSVATMVGRKIGVFPKRQDSYLVPCVFWTAIVARPGERKSAIITFCQRPLDKLEAKAAKEFKEALVSAQARKEVLRQKIEAIKDRMKKATKGSGSQQMEVLQAEYRDLLLEQEDDLIEKRYRTNDATVEKLGELLKGNPNGILSVRDELIGWLTSFDKPGREGDRAFYLEGWDASGAPFSVDRIGRGRVEIESLCLHVMGSIQPGKMEEYIRQAVNGGSGDDGFLQRFQLMVYPEPISKVEWVDEKPNFEIATRVQEIFDWLDDFKLEAVDGKRPGVRFDDEAQSIFQNWSVALEKRFRLGEDEHPAFVSHLSKYLRLMPALSLLFHMIDSAAGKRLKDSISLQHAFMAIGWCNFLEAHARKVYAIVERKDLRDAHALKRKIERRDIADGMKLRDIAHKCWAPFGSDTDAIRAGMHVLETYGYCRIELFKPATGRTSEIIRLNPRYLQNGQN
jgi:hypothetical protein